MVAHDYRVAQLEHYMDNEGLILRAKLVHWPAANFVTTLVVPPGLTAALFEKAFYEHLTVTVDDDMLSPPDRAVLFAMEASAADNG